MYVLFHPKLIERVGSRFFFSLNTVDWWIDHRSDKCMREFVINTDKMIDTRWIRWREYGQINHHKSNGYAKCPINWLVYFRITAHRPHLNMAASTHFKHNHHMSPSWALFFILLLLYCRHLHRDKHNHPIKLKWSYKWNTVYCFMGFIIFQFFFWSCL